MHRNQLGNDEILYNDEQLKITQREYNIFIVVIFTICFFIVDIFYIGLIFLLVYFEAGFEVLIICLFAFLGISIVLLLFLRISRKIFMFRSTKNVSLRFQFLMNPVLASNFPELPFQMNNQDFILSCEFRESERVNDTPLRKYTYIKPKSTINVNAVSPQVFIIAGNTITFNLNTLVDDPNKKWFLPRDLIIHLRKI